MDKITDNSYRNVAVNLLDKMVQSLLEVTMGLFNKVRTILIYNRKLPKKNTNL
jgi:hypothetical protein